MSSCLPEQPWQELAVTIESTMPLQTCTDLISTHVPPSMQSCLIHICDEGL